MQNGIDNWPKNQKNIDKFKDKTLFVSFSGGKTSAMMAKYLKDSFPEHDIRFIFMNTGQEHEETLRFVDRCDKEWGLNLIWLESVVHHVHRVATTHKIVSFETATRGKDLFEEMIKKYGIPNVSFPHCTRELKQRPFESYVKSLGIKKKDRLTLIGMRTDEVDRINENYIEKGFYYPLINLGVSKSDVAGWWRRQPFRLNIPEHYGNCLWCFKKTMKKMKTLLVESPEIFEVPKYLEKYSHIKVAPGTQERRFFRGKLTVDELLKLTEKDFNMFVDEEYTSGCQEVCDAFGS